jgi:SAM-dependent methyltransferase
MIEALQSSEHWPHPDLAILWDRLTEARHVGMPNWVPGNPVRILDLACGPCFESALLPAFFAHIGSPAEPRPVAFHGSDLRESIIREAELRTLNLSLFFKELFGGRDGYVTYDWSSGDASRFTRPAEQVDIVFIRHQNTWDGLAAWLDVFRHACSCLTPGGRLIITSYYDREHQQALELLAQLGARLLYTKQNPHSRLLSSDGKSMDRHLAVLSVD